MFVPESAAVLSLGLGFLTALAAIAPPEASRQAGEKPVIAAAPVGRTPREVVERLLPVLRETFHCDAIVAAGVSLPTSSLDASRGQHLSSAILSVAESDRKGVRFCPEHERELARNRRQPPED